MTAAASVYRNVHRDERGKTIVELWELLPDNRYRITKPMNGGTHVRYQYKDVADPSKLGLEKIA